MPIPVTPHLLRHSCATIRAENAMETVALQCYFGWKSIDTALHYVHLSGRHVLDAARAAPPPCRWGTSRIGYEGISRV